MHHVVLERWSRGSSPLHRRDPRAKLIALLAFLLAVATTPNRCSPYILAYGAVALGAILAARLPLAGVFGRALVVLPFCGAIAVVNVMAREAQRAAALAEKSYVSALAVLVVAGTTPVPRLLQALESLGLPRFLLSVVQLLYRYLFVVSEQAQHMRLAARSRGSASGARFHRWRLRAAAGALAVLFAKSYSRAEGTYRAMLARSFHGHMHLLAISKFTWGDALFMVLGVLAPVGLRTALVLAT